jgi:hypothetical protein
MESAVTLAERLMQQYEDRLSLYRISEEILAVLGEGGLRIGDPVPDDLAGEARSRLELAAISGLPRQQQRGPEISTVASSVTAPG